VNPCAREARIRRDCHIRQAGFTLIEVLVVVALCALVLAVFSQGLALTMQAQRSEARALGRRDELDAVERTLRDLIERMDPGGVSGRPPAFTGEAHEVAFTTTLPEASAGQLTRLVDVQLTLDHAHRLLLAWGPHLPNLVDPAANRQQFVLLQGVKRLDLDYWQPAASGTGGAWVQRWTGRDVPKLIRLRIVPEGAVAAFPDIIAGSARHRWQP
jgi:prepilin-type N-terminal cleavage/methylation domain-containing protein